MLRLQRISTIIFIIIIKMILCSSVNIVAETGVTSNRILLGMSNALSGPAAALGQGLKRGALAYFESVNAAGGIFGRQIEVISYDDGYEPDRAVKNIRKLLEQDKVFALFGFVGTPTSQAAAPIASRAKVPYIGPFTGAEFLRTPPNHNYINIRSSYNEETEKLVKHFIEDLGVTRIGLFIQNDGYGKAGKMGVMRALRKRRIRLNGIGNYKRNTVNIDKGLVALKEANPQAVIMIGAYKACGAFIKKAVADGFKPYFANISFVGTNNLIKEMGKAGEGSYISQVMPHPIDSDLDIVKEYKSKVGSNFSYTSLEGYIDAKVFVEALKSAGKFPTREALRSAFKNLKVDIGGLTTNFSPRRYQALTKVYLTKVMGGRVIEVEKMTK